ncbi:MAG: N-sulfoglucosamine sulfohydrolase [Verrucomicrobiales bacterium]
MEALFIEGMLRRSILSLLTLFLAAPVQAEKPNIVLMIADDMSWDDCGAYGHPSIKTPNIDSLARQGVAFDNAFLTISSCSPSRSSILTGRYPHNTDAEELHWPLPAEQITFTEKLRAAGYWTGAAGKWHLGDAVRDRFDSIKEVDTSGFQLPTGKAGDAGKFVETLEGEAQSGCADWIPLLRERDKTKPFFVWLAALDPHRDYNENILPEPHKPATVRVPPYHVDDAKTRHDYTLYYDEIGRLDKYVGLVLKELEDQGVAENTFVLFISDNGRPFPRDKTTLYDSGIKTPWIVRWPGHGKAGSRRNQVVSAVDIAPSFLTLAGAEIGDTFEGVNFLPVLDDPKVVTRKFAFAEKNWHDYEDHVRMVRGPRFKYMANFYDDLPQTPSADSARSETYEQLLAGREAGSINEAQQACFIAPRPREELYDTQADPHELKNLAGDPEFESVRAKLAQQLDSWAKRTGDYAPTQRTADEFHRLTGKPTPARVRPRRSKAEMVEMGLVAP